MSRRPSPSRARRLTITARPLVAQAHLRAPRKTQSRKLSLEELVGGRTLRLLLHLVRLEPGDFLVQQRDALVELLNREQGQVLHDLVHEIFLRPVVVIRRGHRGPSALQLARLTRPTGMVVPTHLAPPDEKTMAAEQFRFDDGAAYERHMGTWSRLAGDVFLDWWRRSRACAGSMSAAATARSRSGSSSAAHLPRCKASTRRKLNSRSRARGL